jgi:hypothetical protein
MEKLTASEKKIADFIYDKPEVVVKLLIKHGYDISMDTATLPKINELTFNAIFIDNNIEFGKDFDKELSDDGYLNVIPLLVTAGISIVSSIIGGASAKKQAQKQRELQKNIALAGFAQTEKLAMEKLRSESETERTKILARTLLEYRNTLQKESTARLKDTWIYVTGLGIGIGVIYGIYLLAD